MQIQFFCTLVICGLLLLTSCKHPGDKYTIVVDNVEGLNERSEVICAGLPIGKVTHLDLFKDSVVVDIEVSKNFKIPFGSKFIIEKNMLGTTRLIIERSDELSFIKKNDTVRGYKDTSSFTLTSLDTTKQRKIKESIQKIADGFKGLIDASSNDSMKIDSGALR